MLVKTDISLSATTFLEFIFQKFCLFPVITISIGFFDRAKPTEKKSAHHIIFSQIGIFEFFVERLA